jgi:hypothetical protein
MSYTDGPAISLPASGALELYRLVTNNASGQAAYPSADAAGALTVIGVTEQVATAAGQLIPVRLRKASGTHMVTAAAQLANGATFTVGADGKVAANGTNPALGRLLAAASGDGSRVQAVLL